MLQLAPHRAVTRTVALRHGPVTVLDASPTDGSPRRPPALLVPGYTGSKEDFAPVLDMLADAGHRVVALDLPGQHQSPGPDDATAYTMRWLGEVVGELAATISDEPVHLLGHSLGGLIARDAVLAAPSRYRSVTLLSSGPAAIPDKGVRQQRMQAVAPLLPQGMAAVYDALMRLDAETNHRPPVPQALQEFYRRRFVASSPGGLLGMALSMRDEPDRVAGLAATGVPALVCYGENDDAWPPALQADMAVRLGARHEVVADAAHSPAGEQPAATAAVVAAFWAETEAHG